MEEYGYNGKSRSLFSFRCHKGHYRKQALSLFQLCYFEFSYSSSEPSTFRLSLSTKDSQSFFALKRRSGKAVRIKKLVNKKEWRIDWNDEKTLKNWATDLDLVCDEDKNSKLPELFYVLDFCLWMHNINSTCR